MDYHLDYHMDYHMDYHLDCHLDYHMDYHLDYHLHITGPHNTYRNAAKCTERAAPSLYLSPAISHAHSVSRTRTSKTTSAV